MGRVRRPPPFGERRVLGRRQTSFQCCDQAVEIFRVEGLGVEPEPQERPWTGRFRPD